MKEENNNNVNEQQATIEEKQKVMAIYNKIIAIADKITDDYNDDFDTTPNHELLAIGVFLRRMETSLTDKDAIGKDGKPWGDQTPGSTEEPTYASMLACYSERLRDRENDRISNSKRAGANT